MDRMYLIALTIEYAALAACSAVMIFSSQRWVIGALVLWLGVMVAAAFHLASVKLRISGVHPLTVGLFGWPLALFFGWMELVILSFIFPKRFDTRSPSRLSPVGRASVD